MVHCVVQQQITSGREFMWELLCNHSARNHQVVPNLDQLSLNMDLCEKTQFKLKAHQWHTIKECLLSHCKHPHQNFWCNFSLCFLWIDIAPKMFLILQHCHAHQLVGARCILHPVCCLMHWLELQNCKLCDRQVLQGFWHRKAAVLFKEMQSFWVSMICVNGSFLWSVAKFSKIPTMSCVCGSAGFGAARWIPFLCPSCGKPPDVSMIEGCLPVSPVHAVPGWKQDCDLQFLLSNLINVY